MACVDAYAERLAVTALVPENSGIYAEFAIALQASLDLSGGGEVTMRVVAFSNPNAETEDATVIPASDVIISVGSRAAEIALRRNDATPVIAALIPRLTFERLVERYQGAARKPTSAVYLDQPIDRQLALITCALPKSRRIGVLLGPTSTALQANLRQQAVAHGAQLKIATADKETLASALNDIIGVSDALLAVADPAIYNSYTIQKILLATYHRRIPVVGFSEAYVKAGALVGVYSTPAQIGQHVAKFLHQRLQRGAALPAPQYPMYFTVSVNPHVARSLGINIGDAAALQLQLEQQARIHNEMGN